MKTLVTPSSGTGRKGFSDTKNFSTRRCNRNSMVNEKESQSATITWPSCIEGMLLLSAIHRRKAGQSAATFWSLPPALSFSIDLPGTCRSSHLLLSKLPWIRTPFGMINIRDTCRTNLQEIGCRQQTGLDGLHEFL